MQEQSKQYTPIEVQHVTLADLQKVFYKAEFDKKILVDFDNETIEQALREIAETTGLKLTYRGDTMVDKRITLEKKEIGVSEALTYVLKDTGLEFKFSQDGYLLVGHPNASLKAAVVQEEVTGKVTDASTGESLPGVNIIVKGTTTGTSTDGDGNFQLTVPSLSDTLIFSFIGFQTQEVPINGRTEIMVSLTPQTYAGEELVVVGYGTQEKGDVTASISSVSGEDIEEIPVTSTVEALQGQISGMDIQSQGGQPGDDLTIRIRGRRSITASNDPLFVVDGIPFEGGLNDINPQNVKSIDVLKDAAATAIYGSRGANGVILISTKKGRSGPTQVSYDGYYGVTEPLRTVDMFNGEEFANFKRESRRRKIVNGNSVLSWDGDIPPDQQVFKEGELRGLAEGVSTDWQDLVLSRGFRQNHQLSVSGGSENTQFMISGNYFDEKALISTNGFTRYNTRVNIDHTAGDRFRIGASALLSRSIRDWDTNPMGEALRNVPLGKPRDENGNLIFLPVSDGLRSNPLFNLIPGAVRDERVFNHLFASLYAELDIMDNLTYRVNFGPDYETRTRGEFLGSMTNQRRGAPPTAGKQSRETFSYTLENTLNYKTSLGLDHSLAVTVLQSIQSFQQENSSIDVRGLPFESQKFNNLGTAEEILGVDSDLEEWQLSSFMGRVNYDYKGKYLLQLSGRADGSSRLASENKWTFFPGASLGWRVIDEPFMSGTEVLNDLKLRVSYGVVGNTAIDPYQTKGRLNRTTYAFGDEGAFGYRLDEIPNRALGWEKTATFDVGVDFGLYRGRVSGAVDFYVARTTDLLLDRQLPYTSGYNEILQNVGKTRNVGIEVSLNTINLDTDGGFYWATDLNWSRNTEEILELFNANQDDVGNEWFIGQPIEVFYDYEKIGIWQIDEAQEAAQFNQNPGEIKVRDQNNDGKIDGSDRVILGSDVPSWIGGITNRFAYKGFDLSVMAFARVGQMLRSRFHDSFNTLFGRYNNLDVDYWTPTNPTNAFPRPNQNQERPVYSSTMSYFDGSFLKIRNITLGYNLPSNLVSDFGMRRFRVYATVQNAFIISDYKAYDPEDDEEVNATIPTPRLFSFGINVGL